MTGEHRPDVVSDEVRRHPAAREVTTPADLRHVLATRAPLRGVRIQDLDLRPYEAMLLTRTELEGLVVLTGDVGSVIVIR